MPAACVSRAKSGRRMRQAHKAFSIAERKPLRRAICEGLPHVMEWPECRGTQGECLSRW